MAGEDGTKEVGVERIAACDRDGGSGLNRRALTDERGGVDASLGGESADPSAHTAGGAEDQHSRQGLVGVGHGPWYRPVGGGTTLLALR